jgi:molecular chaperone DnaK
LPAVQATTANAEPKQPPRREVVVGIDLGTTNSAVAFIEGGKPRCIPARESRDRVTPSVVSFLPEGGVVVGKAAKKQAASNAGNTYYSVKRIIGRPFNDLVVQQEAARLSYKARQQGWVVQGCG